jgi:cytochrome c553
MKPIRAVTLVALSCLAALPAVSPAAGNAVAGKDKAAACGACHGPDGNSTNPEWPKLAGQHERYLAKQLQEFKANKRVNATMNGMAAALSDADIEDISAYYSSQKVQLGIAAPEAVQLGQKLYRGGNPSTGVAACMSCHGPTGSGNPLATFPALSGQHAAYVVKALQDYRSGVRQNDVNGMMRGVAERLTDKEIKAVAEYVAGLHG